MLTRWYENQAKVAAEKRKYYISTAETRCQQSQVNLSGREGEGGKQIAKRAYHRVNRTGLS